MAINAYDKVGYSSLNLPTLQEMMQIPAYLTQKHEEAQEQIGMLETEGGRIAHLAQVDPEVAKRYTAYQSHLSQLGETLMKKGVAKSNIRANVGKAKSLYMQQIAPVLEADAVLKKDKSLLDELRFKNPSLLINLNPEELTHGAYLKRGNQSYIPPMISGQDLKISFGEKLSRLSTEFLKKNPSLHRSGLPFIYLQELRKGLTPDEVAQVMQGQFDSEDLKGYTNFIKQSLYSTLDEFGVREKFGNNPELLQKAAQVALSGAPAAMGGTQVTNLNDSYNAAIAADERRLERELQLVNARAAAKGDTFDSEAIFNPITRVAPSKSFNKIQETGELLKDDTNITNRRTRERLQKLGISFVNSDGTNKSIAQVKAEFDALHKGVVMAEQEYVINPTSELERSFLSYLKASTSNTERFINEDGKLKGQLRIAPLTGTIKLVNEGKETTLPSHIFGTAVTQELERIRAKVYQVLGLPSDPSTPLSSDAIGRAVSAKAAEWEIDNGKQLYTENKKLLESATSPQEYEAILNYLRGEAINLGFKAIDNELSQSINPTRLAQILVASVGAQQKTY